MTTEQEAEYMETIADFEARDSREYQALDDLVVAVEVSFNSLRDHFTVYPFSSLVRGKCIKELDENIKALRSFIDTEKS